jgi:hypothetical protein
VFLAPKRLPSNHFYARKLWPGRRLPVESPYQAVEVVAASVALRPSR